MIKRSNKFARRILPAILLILALCMLMVSTVFAKSEQKNEITGVKLNKKKTDITVEISLTDDFVGDNKGKDLYLFELLPYQDIDRLLDITPVKTVKADTKISVKLPYYADNSTNRLYSGFVLAQKVSDGSYKIVTDIKYLGNPEILAANKEAFPTGSSKKGLIIDNLTDAQLLGVSHTVVEVPINELMHGENTVGASSIHHNGQTFYIDKQGMAKLEHTVKSYSDAGIAVYLNLVLTPPTDNTDENIKSFYYSDLTYGAEYCAFNIHNEYAVKSLQAFLDYICYRFTATEHTYGFAPAIIVGFDVNSNRTGNSAGPQALETYVKDYAKLFRMVYTSMHACYSEGKVYVSIGNNWTSKVNDLSVTPDESLDYGAKEFLDAFNAAIKTSGDIPWGVSINANPSSDDINEYWTDTRAADSADTEFITMKNIGILTGYLSSEGYLYGEDVRSVIVGDFRISGKPLDTASLNTQAAGYALAYYTAAKNEHIDAFIYGCQTDAGSDEPFYGLRAYSAEGTSASMIVKQPTYDVFSLIDTEKSEDVTTFVQATVGTDSFKAVMGSKPKYKEFNERTVIEAAAVNADDFKGKYKDNTLYDFSKASLAGFYFSDGADYIELRKDENSSSVLYARISGIPAEYKGIGNTSTSDMFKNARLITLDVKPEAPDGIQNLKLMLLLKSNGSEKHRAVIYEGETTLTANEWNKVTFDLRDYVKESGGQVDSFKLLIATEDGESVNGDYGIWLRTATLHVKKGMPIIVKILLGLLIAALILVVVYALLYVRAQLIRKQRRAEAERRKREMMRRQAIMQQQQAQSRQRQTPVPPNGVRPSAPAWPTAQNGQYPNNVNRVSRPPYREGQPKPNLTPNGQVRSDTQVFSTSQINRIDKNR